MNYNDFLFNIDNPQEKDVISLPYIWLRGWVALESSFTEIDFFLQTDDSDFHIDLYYEKRKDVENVHTGKFPMGFNHYLSPLDINPSITYYIVFKTNNDQSGKIPVHFNLDESNQIEFIKIKRNKINLLKTIIACPACKESSLEYKDKQLVCQNCRETFAQNQNNFDFINAKGLKDKSLSATQVSSNPYDSQAIKLIDEYHDHLILDNGCGLRNIYYNNVINFEITDFPTTDVIGHGENLPFRSDCFDVIFSFAVLEHVKDPFSCAKEIERVLKPGGIFYIAVPFLQPFHGYPDHYYNMTINGLKNLFSEQILIDESGVLKSGLPIWALSWFLNSYANGLPKKVRKRFLNYKVRDLLKDPQIYYEEEFVEQLHPETIQELACVNYIIGKKKR
ncbi:Fe-S-containing protein [Bacteroidota bacterium]